MKEPLIQPDRGQEAIAIHLVNKDGFEEFARKLSAPQRSALAAQKFTGAGYQVGAEEGTRRPDHGEEGAGRQGHGPRGHRPEGRVRRQGPAGRRDAYAGEEGDHHGVVRQPADGPHERPVSRRRE